MVLCGRVPVWDIRNNIILLKEKEKMSCKNCEESPIETYVRVGNGNVRIVGCEKHLRELIMKLRNSKEEE